MSYGRDQFFKEKVCEFRDELNLTVKIQKMLY